MSRTQKTLVAAGIIVLAAGAYAAWRKWARTERKDVVEMIGALPADATTMVYIDAAALRESPFFRGLLALAPARQADEDYAQFLRATGFDYERDLDRAAIAFWKRGAETVFCARVEGRFDAKKIGEYALKSGTKLSRDGREIYSTAVGGSTRRATFAFLETNRLALTNDAELTPYLHAPAAEKMAEWRERALRLAGSPFFVIVQQEALLPLEQKPPTPGGVRMEKLPTMIASLRWLTLAARPDADRMRVVAEGECASEDAARQVARTLEGLLMVARVALDDPKTRKEMNPVEREALVDTLNSADVTRIDRGETKAVRLVVEAGPKLLEAVKIQ